MLNENRVEKVNRLKAAEKDRDGLAGKKAEVEAVIDREQQIRKRQNIIFQLQESSALAKVTSYQVKRNETKALLDQHCAKKKDSEEELLSLERTYASKKSEYDIVKKELDEAQSVRSQRNRIKLTLKKKHYLLQSFI